MSILVECLLALLFICSIAGAALSSLRTCSKLQSELRSAHLLSSMTQAIDEIQGAETRYSAEMLDGVLAANARQSGAEHAHCEVDSLRRIIQCNDHRRHRVVQFIVTEWRRDARGTK